MFEQLIGNFWDIIAALAISLISYIAWLLRKTVARMEAYDTVIFGNKEMHHSGVLDILSKHEKRLDIHRDTLITTVTELTKKGALDCTGDIRNMVVDLRKES